MDLVEKAFLQWERLNQPRRARARLVRPEPTLCALQRNSPRPDMTSSKGRQRRSVRASSHPLSTVEDR